MTEHKEQADTPAAAPPDASTVYEEINPDLTQINAYAKAKQAVARDLHYLRELLHQRKREKREERCRSLMAKLADDHFTLAVLGQFKRGKSSLMNAIIGRVLLPTGVLPLTSAITVLRFGPQERLLIEYEGRSMAEAAPLSSLSDYVTERGNPGNRKRIARAVIEMPSQFLRRGLEFVDTPGVGSAIEANTSITHQFLPQCDAVIFITSVESPLSKTEIEFLSQIREHVRKVFFVVNKIDLLGKDEHEEVLRFVAENLQSTMGVPSVRLFPMSCRDGLDAKAQGKPEAYARSGVKAFEETLSEFLSTEKMSTFLVSILDRAIAVVDEELRDVELEARASSMSVEETKRNRLALQQRLEQLRASRERDLSAVQERIHAFVLESAVREMHALFLREEECFGKAVHDAITHHRWRLADGVVQTLQEAGEQQLRRSFRPGVIAIEEHLWPLLEASVQREMLPLVAQLREITKAAAEVLRVDAVSSAISDEPDDLHVERKARALPFTRTLPIQQLEWQNAIPARFSFLPVCWVRDALVRYCQREFGRVLETAKGAICDTVIARSDEVLAESMTQIRQQARELERRVDALVSGNMPDSIPLQDGDPLAKHIEQLKLLQARMRTLRDRMAQSQAPEAESIKDLPCTAETQALNEEALQPASAPGIGDKDIANDLRTRGCPACGHTHRAIFDFFAHWQYEIYRDETIQNLFAAEGGLCRLHTWQLAAIASPRGLSQGYPRLVDRIAGELARLSGENEHLAESVLSLLPDARHCRACHVVRTAETAYLERLSAFLQDAVGFAAYRRSQGLCLRHLALLLKADLPQEIKRELLRHASHTLSATSEDMQSFFLKRDSLRSGLINQDEDDAYLRALVHLAGIKHLAAPCDVDEGER